MPIRLRFGSEMTLRTSTCCSGNGFQLALCNIGRLTTQKFVILVPDPIIFAPWSVLLEGGEPCVTAVKSPHVVVLCFLGPTPNHKSTRRAISSRQRSTECSRRWSGKTARRAEPRNTRPTTTPSSCGATTMAGPREARFMAPTKQSFDVVSKCVFIA